MPSCAACCGSTCLVGLAAFFGGRASGSRGDAPARDSKDGGLVAVYSSVVPASVPLDAVNTAFAPATAPCSGDVRRPEFAAPVAGNTACSTAPVEEDPCAEMRETPLKPKFEDPSRALYDAAWISDFDKAFDALEAGADLTKGFGPRKITAMHVGARTDNVNFVGLLLKKGAPVDIRNKSQETPLMNAVREGAKGVTQLLVDSNADLSLRDAEGLTPLGHARAQDKQEFVDFLIACGGAD